MILQIPRHLLPHDQAQRDDILFHYFPDLYVNSSAVNDHWFINIKRGDSEAFYIDPNLLAHLSWWGGGDLDVRRLYATFKLNRRLMVSFHSAWALYYWSLCLKQVSIQKASFLYLGCHNDLMSPCLIRMKDSWLDGISGKVFDFQTPESVKQSIESGALTNSSCLTPLIDAPLTSYDIVHCVPPFLSNTYPEQHLVIKANPIVDQVLYPGRKKMNVSLENEGDSGFVYHCLSAIEDGVAHLSHEDVFIHIDMSYFNNRYNGQTHWKSVLDLFDPSFEEIKQSISDFFSQLITLKLWRRVRGVSVSLSPGYFSSEYWKPTLNDIIKHIKRSRNYGYNT